MHPPHSRNIVDRLWLRLPDWVFRALGIALVGGIVLLSARRWLYQAQPDYYLIFSGRKVSLPFIPLLIDLTFVTILWGYIVRRRPRDRAVGISRVWIPLFGAVLPMLPFYFRDVAAWLHQAFPSVNVWKSFHGAASWLHASGSGPLIVWLALFSMLTVGTAIDVWGYFALRRSVSVAAEARELVTGGPYQLVRHPVYFGQFLAQAGVCLLVPHGGMAQTGVWSAIYATFFAVQLYRSRVEERVLLDAFGDDYRRWASRVFWFWPIR